MTRLIMQILRVSEEIAKIILGYIPVRRRRLTVSVPSYGSRLSYLPGDLLPNYGRGERTTSQRYVQPPTSAIDEYLRPYLRAMSLEGGSGTWGYLQ